MCERRAECEALLRLSPHLGPRRGTASPTGASDRQGFVFLAAGTTAASSLPGSSVVTASLGTFSQQGLSSPGQLVCLPLRSVTVVTLCQVRE